VFEINGTEFDAALLEIVQHGYQMTHAAAEAIEFPDGECVA
jgi:hypothetical protein